MKVAVISDTHNHLPLAVVAHCAEAEEIWHLGDVTDGWVLTELATLEIPMRVVRGNCDFNPDHPLTLDFTLEEFNIRLIHIPPTTPPVGVDLLLHGHLHVPRNEILAGCRMLNPGTSGGPSKGQGQSMAFLTLDKGTIHWEIIPL